MPSATSWCKTATKTYGFSHLHEWKSINNVTIWTTQTMQRCHAIWIYQINRNHLLQKKKNVINKNISNINHEMLRIQILTLSIELYIDTHYLLGQVFFYFFSLTKTQVARERERESEPFGYLEKLLALMMPTRCTQSNSQHPHLLIP